MLQRQQTLWLLLAIVCSILSYRFPFVTGKDYIKGVLGDFSLTASNNFLILILTGAIILLGGITLTMYKDRKLQIKLCLLGIILAIINIALYVIKMRTMVKPVLALSCIFVLLIVFAFYMAVRGIRHDEKLVKSLDKLR